MTCDFSRSLPIKSAGGGGKTGLYMTDLHMDLIPSNQNRVYIDLTEAWLKAVQQSLIY